MTKKHSCKKYFDYSEEYADEEAVKEIGTVNDAITVSSDRQNQYSNEDTVVLPVDVDESKTD
ncbi:hypothetical protein [Solibacillus isronensis]|uniref:hypothetical protein n=1 Tax=Solibacillus isronensis TaxID=412383 RepID=UPI0020423DA3|nr:hypothetical protein [Solibacillus isronensis]MCM3722912.1 hypothetical protein [Solibacillus isronensis]